FKMAIYAAMIDRVDQNIGRVMDKVRELGKEENTLVMFLSDNGACPGTHHLTPNVEPGAAGSYDTVDMPWANACNTPFRKYKDWCHEGGIATPFIVSWPAGIQNGGTITHQPGHAIDIMATCLDIANTDYPTEHNGQQVLPLDGKSLLPIFEGQTREGHDAIYWQWNRSKAIRRKNWKLVSEFDGPWELYDLETDRTELNNLVDEHPQKVSELDTLWNTWFNHCCQIDPELA
ncbi:MAG: sulfatase-like hydrolase/transferase, partial [Candidatus Latescibacteria bacterium]|nr:sulfatase-like hydrolase/transferase [Candidatus Latescibacterota bacterium]